MEFKTCPSCKASVLDDDAENCPFCGASMSGQPSASPPPQSTPAKSAPATQASTPSSATGTRKQATKGPTGATKKPAAAAKRRAAADPAAEAGDPFEIDTRAVQKATPVSRKPAKGRMHRVVCPMCETAGFIALGHAGKEVKCCNPKCLVPIFTAPAPEKPKEEEPEPKRAMPTVVFTVVAIVLIGGVGVALWHFVLREQDNGLGDNVTLDPVPELNSTSGQNGEDPEVDVDNVEPPPPPPVPLADIRMMSLEEIVKFARQRQNNRSKPYGRRLSSESFTDVGQLDAAVAQIEAMRGVAGYESFYEVEPWVLIALARLEAGDRDAANLALDEALGMARFPSSGRTPLDAAGALAAALAAVERFDEARQVAGDNAAPELRGRLSTLWRGAIDSATYEIDRSSTRPDLSSMPNPQWVSVTRSLVFRGDVDAALAWAESAESAAVRDNALAAWAAELVLSAPSPADAGALAQIEQLVGRHEPAGRVRVWAAVAHVQRERGGSEAADAALQRATAAAAELTIPSEPRPVPTLVEIYESDGRPRAGLPDQADYVAAALAFVDLAQLEATGANTDQAWSHVMSALQLLRAATPSPVATQDLVSRCTGDANIAAIKRRLVSELEVSDEFLAFNQYRKQCGILNEQATLRFRVQVELLRRAVAWGLESQVWGEIQLHNDSPDLNDREPYLSTSLPGMIVLYAESRNDAALVESVTTTVPASSIQVAARDRLELDFAAALNSDDLIAAEAALQDYRRRNSQDPYPMYLVALQGVSRLIAEDRHDRAFELAMRIPYPLAREDAYWLIAAASMRDGRYSEIWRRKDLDRLSPTENVALYRGFIDGLPLAPQEPEPEEVAADTD